MQVKDYDFWRNWKRKTRLEKAAINSLRTAKRIILHDIPKDKIIAIYTGGSFVRREMNKASDVDTWTIVSDSRLLASIKKLGEKYRHATKPELGISGYSLWEFKTNRYYPKGKVMRPPPSRFLTYVKHYKLIYGKQINPADFQKMNDKQEYARFIKVFRDLFIPMYQRKKFDFQGMLKQVFFLTYLELSVNHKNPPYSWRGVAKLCPKNHIIHESLKLRENITNDRKVKRRFIIKIQKHLDKLRGELK